MPPEQRLAGLNNVDFFVATSRDELEAQPELQAFLDTRLSIARDGSPDNWRFVVYHLKRAGVTVQPRRISLVAGSPSPQSVHLRTLPTARWRVQVPTPEIFEVLPSEGTGPATLTIVPHRLSGEPDQSDEVSFYATENR